MKSDGKEETLGKLRIGELHILLATQVIEICVHVPDASIIRETRQSKCILIASTTIIGLNCLKILEQSSDAFHLANMYLLLCGPGDLLGKKQYGHLFEFPINYQIGSG
jgi:ATP-dependent DNA helicase RecG